MPRRPEPPRLAASLLLAALLGACAGPRQVPIDASPTLRSLASREIDVQPDERITADEAQAIVAYQRFLETTPSGEKRGEALRRLGDLEMDNADNRAAGGTGDPDYRAAVARYQEYLKAYPDDPAQRPRAVPAGTRAGTGG